MNWLIVKHVIGSLFHWNLQYAGRSPPKHSKKKKMSIPKAAPPISLLCSHICNRRFLLLLFHLYLQLSNSVCHPKSSDPIISIIFVFQNFRQIRPWNSATSWNAFGVQRRGFLDGSAIELDRVHQIWISICYARDYWQDCWPEACNFGILCSRFCSVRGYRGIILPFFFDIAVGT